jgi:hypothetical protein
MSQADEMNEPDRQVALALAALNVAFARVLQELAPDAEPLVILQRKVQVEQTRLRKRRAQRRLSRCSAL